jgi:hypothetical protein
MNRQYCITVTGKHLFKDNIWVVTFPENQPREKDFYAITSLEFLPGFAKHQTYCNPMCLFTKTEAEKFINEQKPDKREHVYTMVKKSELKVIAAEKKLKQL